MSLFSTSLDPKKAQWIVFGFVWGAVMLVICAICWILFSPSKASSAKSEEKETILTASKRIDPRDVWIDRMESEAKETNKRLRELEQAYSTLAQTKFSEADSETKQVIDALQGQINELQIQLDKTQENGTKDEIGADQGQSNSSYNLSFSNTRTPRVIKLNLKNQKGTGGTNHKTVENTIPAGAFATAVLLGGIDASTAVQSAADPRPVLLRIVSRGTLPRKFKSDLKHCHVLASSHGDLSSERVFMRLEKLTCTEPLTGEISETQVAGYVAGEDGRAGVRGVVVDKTSELMRNTLLGGFASGMSKFFAASNQANVYPVTPFGQTNALTNGEMLRSGAASGVGSALEKYADYYIKRAEQLQPVLQVQAGRKVNIVFTEGTEFGKTTVKEVISQAREGALRDSRQKIQEEAIRSEALKADEAGTLNMESLSRWLPNKGDN